VSWETVRLYCNKGQGEENNDVEEKNEGTSSICGDFGHGESELIDGWQRKNRRFKWAKVWYQGGVRSGESFSNKSVSWELGERFGEARLDF